jgi:dolichol-phosphate mannosyltransferase
MLGRIKPYVSDLVQHDIRVYTLVRHHVGRLRPFLPHEPDFAAFRLLPKRGGSFLDIGANDGISALSFRVFDEYAPIISIEPNPYHRKALEQVKRRIKGFNYLLVCAGEEDGWVRLFTPVYRGYPLTSYACLDPEVGRRNLERWMPIRNLWKEVVFTETNVPIKRLDGFGFSPDYIKIDAEGYEDRILRGLVNTLTAYLPSIMVEYNPASFHQLSELLQQLDYRAFVYDRAHGRLTPYVGQTTQNVFFVHPETHAQAVYHPTSDETSSRVETMARSAPVDATPVRRTPELAIVVPTLNEVQNIDPLIARLDTVLLGIDWELIFVDDDSGDGTGEHVRMVSRSRPEIRLIQRFGRNGLASACVEGMLATSAPYVAVMDADLQHDESILPQMFRALRSEPLDVVVGSRHLEEGGTASMSHYRGMLSQLGARISSAVCRCELSDPMSGYFILTRSFLSLVVRRLSGVGFKILVDMLASSPRPVRLKEVPYKFRKRLHGESKLDINAGLEYFLLVADKLCGDIAPPRYVGYVVVGSFGLVLYLALVRLAYRGFGLTLIDAQFTAAFAAIIFKFLVNNVTTYRDLRLRGWGLVVGFIAYCAACAFGAVANVGVAQLLTGKGLPWYVAAAFGLMIGSVWDYGVTAVLTWRMLRRRARYRAFQTA